MHVERLQIWPYSGRSCEDSCSLAPLSGGGVELETLKYFRFSHGEAQQILAGIEICSNHLPGRNAAP